MIERIENIRLAVEAMHNCVARHERSIPICEMFGEQTVWEGVVEAFALDGHPHAKRCYAWSYMENRELQYIGVLELPPVESAITAVRAAIASGTQS